MSWLRGPRDDACQARVAAPADRPALNGLLADTWRRHGSLASEEQAALLQNGCSTLACVRDVVVGFLGLTPRAAAGAPPEQWVDVSAAVLVTDRPAGRLLHTLIEAALPVLTGRRCSGLVCLAAESWLQDGLQKAGFVEEDRVVTYAHMEAGRLPTSAEVARLAPAGVNQAAAVLALNAAAFTPFWRYDDSTILTWLMAADHGVLAQLDGRHVGFALTSTSSASGHAYLIRVATHPEVQRLGIGRQLVADALQHAYRAGAPGLALNTQASNLASRRLYESLGFRTTGQELAVMVYRLAPAAP